MGQRAKFRNIGKFGDRRLEIKPVPDKKCYQRMPKVTGMKEESMRLVNMWW